MLSISRDIYVDTIVSGFIILFIFLPSFFNQNFVISQHAYSLTNPQNYLAPSKLTGPIVSVQFSHDETASWIISGRWRIDVNYDTTGIIPLSTRNFNASLVVVSTDGTNTHRYKLSDLKVDSLSYNNKTNTSTSSGTISILTEDQAINNVAISIRITNNKIIILGLDPSKTSSYFGETPIYGLKR